MATSKVFCKKCGVILILADGRQRPKKCGNCGAVSSLEEIEAQCNCLSCGTLYAAGLPACPECHVHRVVQKTSGEGQIAPYEVDPSQMRRDPVAPKPKDGVIPRKTQQTKVPAKIDS